jgi:hypothetical protein
MNAGFSMTEIKAERKFMVLVMALATIFSFAFLELNNQAIRKANPANIVDNAKSLVHGQTIFSIDNEYYLSPVDNYLDGKGWRRTWAVGDGDYVRRVPGYSLLYLAFVKVFGGANAFFWLKIFQVMVFVSTIPLVFYLARQVSPLTSGKIVTLIYAFTPFFFSWAYFTLTEAISPALTLLYVVFAWRGYTEQSNSKRKLVQYVIASAFFAAAILTRPYIALSGIILLYFTGHDYIFRRPVHLFKVAIAWMLPALFIGAWAYRNYRVTEEIVFLEKAYHPQSLDRMKPEFRGMFTFTKSWGEDGADFTRYHEPFFWPAVQGDTSSTPIHHILKSWPDHVVRLLGYDKLYSVLKQHQEVIAGYRPYYENKRAMPDSFTNVQMITENAYRNLISEFRKKAPMEFYVTARLKYLKRAIIHSNTPNIFLFQQPKLAIPWIIYKALLLLIHVSVYLALFLNLVLMKGLARRIVFVYTPLLLLFFLCFIHREVEARYMLPLLPLVIIGSGVVLDRALTIFKLKRS